jgi:nucleotide-binding universal stress UspA family protein
VSLPARPDWSYVNEARDGDVVSEILAAAQAHRVDLIVMATHGRDDLADLLRGSRTERVVRSATVPVLAVPAFA